MLLGLLGLGLLLALLVNIGYEGSRCLISECASKYRFIGEHAIENGNIVIC
jgi:hypothetical protein